jgi:hypothetical protein
MTVALQSGEITAHRQLSILIFFQASSATAACVIAASSLYMLKEPIPE